MLKNVGERPAPPPPAPARRKKGEHPFWCVIPVAHEPGRFHVQSRSRSDVLHLVDLMEGPFGTCSCEQFQFRIGPKQLEPGHRVSTASLCWHLKVVLGFIGWEVRLQLRETLRAKKRLHES